MFYFPKMLAIVEIVSNFDLSKGKEKIFKTLKALV